MKPTIVEHQQGTDAWHQHRATHLNASDLAAAMGVSKYKSRADFIKERATGVMPEIDAATQRRFDKGHEFEAIARLWAEEIIGDELYPVVLAADVDGLPLSASLDGQTMLGTVIWEHKTGSASLIESLERGVIPDAYHPQLEQQMMLSGADKCLFMASSGTRETERHAWYESNGELRAKIIPTWVQFLEDLANYVHVEQTVAAVAAPIEALPALAVNVSGSISLTHNLERFGKRLTVFVAGLNSKPETDQDFADLDAAVKVLKEAEAALDSAEKNALAQTTTIADMCSLVEMYRKVARDNRLMFEKVVKQEKINRKAAIISQASTALAGHITALNNRLGASYMPSVPGGFVEAVAGLKSLDSMRDKVAGALANAKIEANEIADRIEANKKAITVDGANYSYLVHDFAQICTKPTEDFAAIIAQRIAAHKAAEAEKAEAAKKAEDARIAAAVEAERKAGEARAAAAVEAERVAEAKRVAEAAQQDQRGKTEDATHAVQQATELPQAPAAITPPTPAREAMAAHHDANDAGLITEFLALQACSPAAKKEMRAAIEKWENFRIKMAAARGLAR